jgi:hypothetical protein
MHQSFSVKDFIYDLAHKRWLVALVTSAPDLRLKNAL